MPRAERGSPYKSTRRHRAHSQSVPKTLGEEDEAPESTVAATFWVGVGGEPLKEARVAVAALWGRRTCSQRGGSPRCRARAPGCAGPRVCGTGASAGAAGGLQSRGWALGAHGLSCSLACGIFPDQEWNPCPLHWQEDSLPLGPPGKLSKVVFFSFLFFFAEWTTHTRKGLPALLTLQALSEFPECLCEPCTQYSATSQTWTSQWAGSWQEGWGTVLEGHLVQTHNPAFRNHRWLLKA